MCGCGEKSASRPMESSGASDGFGSVPARKTRVVRGLGGGQFGQQFRVSADQFQQALRSAAGLLAALLPFLQGAHADACGPGKLRLRHARTRTCCQQLPLRARQHFLGLKGPVAQCDRTPHAAIGQGLKAGRSGGLTTDARRRLSCPPSPKDLRTGGHVFAPFPDPEVTGLDGGGLSFLQVRVSAPAASRRIPQRSGWECGTALEWPECHRRH